MSRHIRFWSWLVGILLLTLEPAHTFLHGNEATLDSHGVSPTATAAQWQSVADTAHEEGLAPEECLLCNGLLRLCVCPTPFAPEVSAPEVPCISYSAIYAPGVTRNLSDAGQDDGQAQAGQHGGLGDDFGQFHGVGTPGLVVLGDWRAHFAPSGYYAPKTRKIKPPNKQFSAVMPPPLTLCFIFWCPPGEKTPHKQSRLQVRTSTPPLLALWTRDTVRLSRKISERMSKGILGLESTKNSR